MAFKLKTRTQFPAVVSATSPLTIAKNGFSYTFGMSVDELRQTLDGIYLPQTGGPYREQVTSARTYFVRSDGSNSNNGRADTAGGAFLTIQHAVDVVCSLIDIVACQITIQLQSGVTFAENVVLKNYVSSGLVATQNEPVIKGDATNFTNSANYTVNAGAGIGFVSVRNACPWRLVGFTIRGTNSSSGTCIESDFGSVIYVSSSMRFGAAQFHMLAVNSAQIEAISNYEIAGNCVAHVIASGSGSQFIQQGGLTVTLTGTPAFAAAFLSVADGASVLLRSITYTGTATGVRWLADYTAIIDVVAGNAPTIPADLETAFANCGSVAGGYSNAKPVAGGGTGTISVFTPGSIVFAAASGVYSQDNPNLFWDPSGHQLGLGVTAPQSRLDLSTNANAASLAAPFGTTTTVARFSGPSGGASRIGIDAFGGNAGYGFRRANGTPAALTPLASGDNIGQLEWLGTYNNGSGVGLYAASGRALIRVSAAENWTGVTVNGTNLEVLTTPTGSATAALSTRFQASGGVSIGTTTDPGIGALLANTSIKSQGATAGIGYATGAGLTVSQATNRTTGVTINAVCGAITLFSQVNTAVSQATAQSFTVTNSAVAATDVIVMSQKSGTDKYEIFITAVGAGSFQITNYAVAGTTNEAPVFNFAVVKAVTS